MKKLRERLIEQMRIFGGEEIKKRRERRKKKLRQEKGERERVNK
jgi:hypothetical protein